MKKIGILILAIGMIAIFAGCKDPADKSVELTKIEITNQADKLEYQVGQELDTTGLEITATYSDETTKVVTGWTPSGYDKTKTGEQTVTVSYTEEEVTAKTSYTVTVKEVPVEPEDTGKDPAKVELTKIEITKEPTKKDYHIDDEIDLAGMVVTANYNDGSTKTLASTEYTVTGFDSSAYVNDKEITVTYEGKTAKFTINVVFNWYETPLQLSDDTGGTYGTEGTYVWFGVWPQDVVRKDDEAGLALDENAATTIERGSFKYVKGSDGNYYVKCTENAFESGYKYEKDNSTIGQGGTTSRWFKVMPIKWRVADSAYKDASGSAKGKLLVAESILTANVPYYEDDENNREIEGKTVYPNNYMHSQIRAYLNGSNYDAADSADENKWLKKGFLQTAFTSEAAAKIETTKVDNSEDSTTNYDTQNGTIEKATDYACDPTDDKIFLLSEYEVTKYSKSTEAYNNYGKGNSRIRVTTDFAKANNAYQRTTDGCGGYWWLRSPHYYSSNLARGVQHEGDARSPYSDVRDTIAGVVPALAISF